MLSLTVAADEHRMVAGDPDVAKAHYLCVFTKVRERLVPDTRNLGEAAVRAQWLSVAIYSRISSMHAVRVLA